MASAEAPLVQVAMLPQRARSGYPNWACQARRQCRQYTAETRVSQEALFVPKTAPDHRERPIVGVFPARAKPENRHRRKRLLEQSPSFQSGCRKIPDDRKQEVGRHLWEKSPIFQNGRLGNFDCWRERPAMWALLATGWGSPGPILAPAGCRSVAAVPAASDLRDRRPQEQISNRRHLVPPFLET
jgi:hypothetical protein